MPLPGGPSNKLGNSYETLWTVVCMINVMDEEAKSIRLEPPGTEGEGVEFWIQYGDKKQFHQVKRHQGTKGVWSLADLNSKKILFHFFNKLNHLDTECKFISISDALDLREITERARSAISLDEFKRAFLNTDKYIEQFHSLRNYWKECDEIIAFERLKRIYIESISENMLIELVRSRIGSLVEGELNNIIDILAQLTINSIHKELTAYDIWHHLDKRGVRRRQWGKDHRILKAVEEQNNRYLEGLKKSLISGQTISREEVSTVFKILHSSNGKQAVLLTGPAGIGKSSVIAQILDEVKVQGIPVLAFRVDHLEPVMLPDKLGDQLGLPASPVHVLANISCKKKCLLIIDQLDAVSLASGRNPNFFSCIEEIIHQSNIFPNMHLLLACRTFDLDNDHRLRQLTGNKGIAEIVTVNPLQSAKVKEIISSWDVNTDSLSTKQLDVLKIPLHLYLLSEIIKYSIHELPSFTTTKELYDQFWKYKKDSIRERLGKHIQWTKVIDMMCNYMSDHQILSVPTLHLDDIEYDAQIMASEHILIQEDNRYRFIHESFFDYAFARRFVAHNKSILPFLLASEQHLFRRAQVRQILIHLRESEPQGYIEELSSLLTNSDVRFHIKQLICAVLGQLDKPTEQEWYIIESLIINNKTASLIREIWRNLHHSLPWFQLCDSLGIIEKWLSDEQRVEQIVLWISNIQKHILDRIAALIEPYIGKSEKWHNYFAYLMLHGDTSVSRKYFNILLRLIDEGIFDENDIWDFIYSLHKKRPAWSCEVIGHYLNRRLILSLNDNEPNPFKKHIPYGHVEEIFLESARKAPKTFYDQVFPFMLQLLDLNVERKGKKPYIDFIWRYFFTDFSDCIKGILLKSMENALSELATKYTDIFKSISEKFQNLDYYITQYLLIRAYTANGKYFADEAISYLGENPIRLQTGDTSDDDWASRQLIEAVTPYCSEQSLLQLEKTLLSYYPKWEKSLEGYRSHGRAQYGLLDRITPNRRSKEVNLRL